MRVHIVNNFKPRSAASSRIVQTLPVSGCGCGSLVNTHSIGLCHVMHLTSEPDLSDPTTKYIDWPLSVLNQMSTPYSAVGLGRSANEEKKNDIRLHLDLDWLDDADDPVRYLGPIVFVFSAVCL